MNPANTRVVITGASSGIGAATAIAFARDGAMLVLAARGKEGLDDVARRCREAGGSAELVYRHKVRNGDLMMWDNGCTMHRRDEMQLNQPRLMKRTTFRLAADAYCVPH